RFLSCATGLLRRSVLAMTNCLRASPWIQALQGRLFATARLFTPRDDMLVLPHGCALVTASILCCAYRRENRRLLVNGTAMADADHRHCFACDRRYRRRCGSYPRGSARHARLLAWLCRSGGVLE